MLLDQDSYDRGQDAIEIITDSTAVARFVGRLLSKNTVQMVAKGIVSIYVAYQKTNLTVRMVRREAQVEYSRQVRVRIAYKYEATLRQIEQDRTLRPSIRNGLLQDLENDLGIIRQQITDELRRW